MKIYKINGKEYLTIPQTIAYNGGRLSLPPTTTDEEWQRYGGTISEREPMPPETQLEIAARLLAENPNLTTRIEQLSDKIGEAVAIGATFSSAIPTNLELANELNRVGTLEALLLLSAGQAIFDDIKRYCGEYDAYDMLPYFMQIL